MVPDWAGCRSVSDGCASPAEDLICVVHMIVSSRGLGALTHKACAMPPPHVPWQALRAALVRKGAPLHAHDDPAMDVGMSAHMGRERRVALLCHALAHLQPSDLRIEVRGTGARPRHASVCCLSTCAVNAWCA